MKRSSDDGCDATIDPSSSSASSPSSSSSLVPSASSSADLDPAVTVHMNTEEEEENGDEGNGEYWVDPEEESCGCPSSTSLSDRQSLFDLVSRNDVAGLSQALREPRVNVNRRYDGRVLLSLAAKKGYLQCAQLLLKKGKANVNLLDINDNTALMYVVIENNFPLLDFLLQSKADPTIQNKNGWNALMTASFYGHNDMVKQLVEYPGCVLDTAAYDGFTSLMLAAISGRLSVVETLILRGANVRLRNKKGVAVFNIVPRPKEVSKADLKDTILSSLAKKAKASRFAFLSGGISNSSSLPALLRDPLFDRETVRLIFQFADIQPGCEHSQV